jgi:hypothetical protein
VLLRALASFEGVIQFAVARYFQRIGYWILALLESAYPIRWK